MVSSLDLPTEVFAQILSLIPRRQLHSCALVSKLWYAQTTPLLYQQINLTWSCPVKVCREGIYYFHLSPCRCEELGTCRHEQHQFESPRRHFRMEEQCLRKVSCAIETWPSFFALVKTLVRSPSSARLVRYLRLAGPVPRSIWTTPQQTGLSNDERQHIGSILPYDSHMSKAGWLRRLDNGCPQAFAALLLICVSDLRSLDMGLRFQDSLRILGFRTLVRTMHHLDTVSVGSTRETVFMGSTRGPATQADDFPQLLLLHLTGVRSLTLNLPQPCTPYTWSDATCGALTTSLDTLELAFTFLNENDLASLLQVCPRLRSFKYDYCTTPTRPGPLDTHNF
jgi:hypothetical protein